MLKNGAHLTIICYLDGFLLVAPEANTHYLGLYIMLDTCVLSCFHVQPLKTLSIAKYSVEEVIHLMTYFLAHLKKKTGFRI